MMCLVFAQDGKTPEIGIEGECGARTLKTRERNVRCESRHCRRLEGLKAGISKKRCCCSQRQECISLLERGKRKIQLLESVVQRPREE